MARWGGCHPGLWHPGNAAIDAQLQQRMPFPRKWIQHQSMGIKPLELLLQQTVWPKQLLARTVLQTGSRHVHKGIRRHLCLPWRHGQASCRI
jgi:hypothetical protein